MFISLFMLMAFSILGFLAIYKLARKGFGAVPVDDFALFTCLCICLYTLLPVTSWLLQGGEYLIPVGRLYQLQPTISEVFTLTLLGVGPIFGVIMVYFFRRSALVELNSKSRPVYNWWISSKLLFICAGLVVGVYVFQTALKFRYGMLGADSYAETYTQYRALPSFIAQVLAASRAFFSVCMIVVLAGLVMRWNSGGKKWLIMIAVFVALSFEVGYSRTQLFSFILLFYVLYSMFVQPVTSLTKSALFFLLVLIVFLLLGIRGEGVFSLGVMPLGEFDTVWANGAVLLRERDAGSLSVPLSAFSYEFLNFIPSQFLPYEKIDMQNWFLDTYYPAFKSEGGGLMFGLVAQSIVGFGLAEAVLRGVIVGFISIELKQIIHKHHSCWSLILFLIVYLKAYEVVRIGNFSGLFGILGATLFVILAIRFLVRVLPSKKHLKMIRREVRPVNYQLRR